MEARGPVTVVIGQFEDLVARGLRALIAEDANIEIVRAGFPHEQSRPRSPRSTRASRS